MELPNEVAQLKEIFENYGLPCQASVTLTMPDGAVVDVQLEIPMVTEVRMTRWTKRSTL